MTFKLDLSHLFQTVTNDANNATVLFNKTNSYVQVAEQIGKAWGLTGPQKLESVKSMLLADLQNTSPQLAAIVSKAETELSAAISITVSIFNAVSWAFVQAAPIIVTVSPETATAITAISAAIGAAQAIEKAVQP